MGVVGAAVTVAVWWVAAALRDYLTGQLAIADDAAQVLKD